MVHSYNGRFYSYKKNEEVLCANMERFPDTNVKGKIKNSVFSMPPFACIHFSGLFIKKLERIYKKLIPWFLGRSLWELERRGQEEENFSLYTFSCILKVEVKLVHL